MKKKSRAPAGAQHDIQTEPLSLESVDLASVAPAPPVDRVPHSSLVIPPAGDSVGSASAFAAVDLKAPLREGRRALERGKDLFAARSLDEAYTELDKAVRTLAQVAARDPKAAAFLPLAIQLRLACLCMRRMQRVGEEESAWLGAALFCIPLSDPKLRVYALKAVAVSQNKVGNCGRCRAVVELIAYLAGDSSFEIKADSLSLENALPLSMRRCARCLCFNIVLDETFKCAQCKTGVAICSDTAVLLKEIGHTCPICAGTFACGPPCPWCVPP